MPAAVRILVYKHVWRRIFAAPEPIDWREIKVLCVGLDGAGKSALVSALSTTPSTTEFGSTPPTRGFKVHTVVVPPDLKVEVWEVGGESTLRPFWNRYADGSVEGVVWAVDSADAGRFTESAGALAELFRSAPMLRDLPLLVLLCKSELESAQGADVVSAALGLAELSKRRLVTGPRLMQSVSAIDGRNLVAGFSWLAAPDTEADGQLI